MEDLLLPIGVKVAVQEAATSRMGTSGRQPFVLRRRLGSSGSIYCHNASGIHQATPSRTGQVPPYIITLPLASLRLCRA